jgi:uncharacterized membrane protein
MSDAMAAGRSASFNKPDERDDAVRWLSWVNAALFIGLWIFVIAAYSHLPERIPQHMGLDGQPTRMGDRGIWFLLPIIMSTSLIVMYALAMTSMTADGFTVPQKKRLLALPREQQRYALQPMRGFLLGMATWLLALNWAIQLEMYHAARHGSGSGYALPIILFFALLPLGAMVPLNRAVKRRIEELEGEAA